MTMFLRTLGTAALAAVASTAIASPTFFNTTSPSNWQVATNLPPGSDAVNFGQFQDILNLSPVPWAAAVACTGRAGWIANIASCTNGAGGNIGGTNWTQFIFRQSFNLTGAEAASLQLSFRWAADDSGEIGATRGTWQPKWSLNSLAQGALQSTPWPAGLGGIPTSYGLSQTVTVSGFKEGENTMYFWVQGNGRTDGMQLTEATFSQVPVPASLALIGLGMLAAGVSTLSARRAGGRSAVPAR